MKLSCILILLSCLYSALSVAGDKNQGLVAHYYRDAPNWEGNWPASSALPIASPAAWTFTHYSYTRVEPLVNHAFMRSAFFSVRWQGQLEVAVTGVDRIGIKADDGCRLWIDGHLLIDSWVPCSETDPKSFRVANKELLPGTHSIVVEYFQGTIMGKHDKDPMRLMWAVQGQDTFTPVPASVFSHSLEDMEPHPGRLD